MAKKKITKKQRETLEETYLLISRIVKLKRLPQSDSKNAIERADATAIESIRKLDISYEKLMIFVRTLAFMCHEKPDLRECLEHLFPEFFGIKIGLINALMLELE